MDSRNADRFDEHAAVETPEDVAVLYSWANLHGAKYRDFSASRREYRAQLRHRAAEQVREQALLAQAEAETAAEAADAAARQAVAAARTSRAADSGFDADRSLLVAEEAARTAAAERVEAARRAEAAAIAEAAARREEREIAEAHASAQRQAARYADSEMRRRAADHQTSTSAAYELQGQTSKEIPGEMSDPYTAGSSLHATPPGVPARRASDIKPAHPLPNAASPAVSEQRTPAPLQPPTSHPRPRRPQGYRPDEASGVRQIYRGPDLDLPLVEYTSSDPLKNSPPPPGRSVSAPAPTQEMTPTPDQPLHSPRQSSSSSEGKTPLTGQRRTDPQPQPTVRPPQATSAPAPVHGASEPWSPVSVDRPRFAADPTQTTQRDATAPSSVSVAPRPVSPFSQALVPSDSTRGRRAQDDFDYQQSQVQSQTQQSQSVSDSPRRSLTELAHESLQRSGLTSDPAGPAWLYAPPAPQLPQRPLASAAPQAQSSVADTLQHSRERVAARWFALKGVFEQPGQDQPEAAPIRQKETRTPVLAVFSLAGGVGKTSLVATVGRALSSMGEKVLLTDTTSHGLLPFYFGASELRQGSVRTFSPPSGSTDAPIYLVSYAVEQQNHDDAAQELLAEEILNNSRGTHRILLDLTVNSSWIIRRLSRMNPTILVPVAPDMNSVISLQMVEKFFSGVNDGDGRPLQPFYVLNQFDTSLPLHLDIREVMRRQLGDRLLPFVIRRAPAVSEALAEGMTVVDYAPDAPVAEDYLNLATWLRTVAAPATAGFRNVRWSER
ncbi:cellulose synthase operon protein YhjQ/BcsQ [Granulicella sp. L60]|uniref:cellulose synthase operon protein YhjQ/BcsQ n=1 Tax=Granulicella sp. L60 TaxID=1641866 RepID=UPI00131AD1D1|nr:cellulose synthase operon protein YhjQ/BcsQ [Granulicella sp. L60]